MTRTLQLKQETFVATADEFLNRFEVSDEELTKIYPDYPELREEHGEDMPIYELLEEPDGEIIEAVLRNRESLFDMIFHDDNNGKFRIRELEVVDKPTTHEEKLEQGE